MNLLSIFIFLYALSSPAMEVSAIEHPVLAQIHQQMLDMLNARKNFIESVASEWKSIDDNEQLIQFFKEIFYSNGPEDKLIAPENLAGFKEGLSQFLADVLLRHEEFQSRMTTKLIEHDNLMANSKKILFESMDSWSEDNIALLTEIEKINLIQIYLFLLEEYDKKKAFNNHILQQNLRHKCQRQASNRKNSPGILGQIVYFIPKDGINRVYNYEIVMHIISSMLGKSMTKLLTNYRDCQTAENRRNFLNNYREQQKKDLTKIGKENARLYGPTQSKNTDEDAMVSKNFDFLHPESSLLEQANLASLKDKIEDLLKMAKISSQNKKIHLLSIEKSILELANLATAIDEIENLLQRAKVRSHLVKKIESVLNLPTTSSPSNLLPPLDLENVVPSLEKPNEIICSNEHDGASPKKTSLDYIAVLPETMAKTIDTDSQCDNNKDAQRKMRILKRLNIPDEKPLKSIVEPNRSKEKASILMAQLASKSKQLFHELMQGENHHKTYSFHELLVLVKDLGGKRIYKKTGGSHFTYSIEGIGSLHLVYSHGKKDSTRLSGNYVRAFIKQLLTLGFHK